MGAQLSMLENDTANYISPDASIVFAFVDGDLTMRTSETFTIGDALLSKIKRLFANLYATWTQFCFRDTMERGLQPSAAADPQRDSEATPEAADEADFDEFFSRKIRMGRMALRSNRTAGGGRRPASTGRM